MRAQGTRFDTEPPAKSLYLWLLALGPGLWALHFLLCYATAAIWCAKAAAGEAGLGPVRVAVAVYTLLALAGIVATGWNGWQRHRHGEGEGPHDDDSPGDRHRFLGFATVLLSGLSVVAVVYTALAAVFIGSCR